MPPKTRPKVHRPPAGALQARAGMGKMPKPAPPPKPAHLRAPPPAPRPQRQAYAPGAQLQIRRRGDNNRGVPPAPARPAVLMMPPAQAAARAVQRVMNAPRPAWLQPLPQHVVAGVQRIQQQAGQRQVGQKTSRGPQGGAKRQHK